MKLFVFIRELQKVELSRDSEKTRSFFEELIDEQKKIDIITQILELARL